MMSTVVLLNSFKILFCRFRRKKEKFLESLRENPNIRPDLFTTQSWTLCRSWQFSILERCGQFFNRGAPYTMMTGWAMFQFACSMTDDSICQSSGGSFSTLFEVLSISVFDSEKISENKLQVDLSQKILSSFFGGTMRGLFKSAR